MSSNNQAVVKISNFTNFYCVGSFRKNILAKSPVGVDDDPSLKEEYRMRQQMRLPFIG